MSLLAAAALGLLIGAVLGALGGGGSILTVPILVYLLGQSGQDATTSSLVIVGVTAVLGALGYARAGQLRWRVGAAFGAAGIGAAFLGSLANRLVDERVLLLGFAGVMVLAAAGMRRRHACGTSSDCADSGDTKTSSNRGEAAAAPPEPATPLPVASPRGRTTTLDALAPDLATHNQPAAASARPARGTVAKVVAAGALVGFLTGFFGVGGGFVIVPALVLVLGLPMPAAVGTSLFIIAVNSAVALASRGGQAHFDWSVIIPFTLGAVAGTVAGQHIAGRVSGQTLTRAFAILLLLVAGFIGIHSLLALT